MHNHGNIVCCVRVFSDVGFRAVDTSTGLVKGHCIKELGSMRSLLLRGLNPENCISM